MVLPALRVVVCVAVLTAGAGVLQQNAPVENLTAPAVISVHDDAQLRAALRAARPGTEIAIAPGDYAGGLYAEGLRGEPERPIVIRAANPEQPPAIIGGVNGLHLVDPRHVQLVNLKFRNATGNGLNVDDGGDYVPVARGLVFRGLHVAHIGPRGNHDAIKLSGLDGFLIEDCLIEHWGLGSGSGIDMVGCHDGLIVHSTLRHAADPNATGGSGIQAKGGSRAIVIRHNRFEHAGARAVNLGGSTGLEYFRPPLDTWFAREAVDATGASNERFEAAELIVEGNLLIGSQAPIAFVGVDGATVRWNTIVDPGRWAVRILQENTADGFVPCRRGIFSENIVVFRAASWSSGGLNIGPGTAPESFEFAGNAWFCRDAPERSQPALPVDETDGLYGIDPELDSHFQCSSPGAVPGRGAGALPCPTGRPVGAP
jgi:Right handed beta helix region